MSFSEKYVKKLMGKNHVEDSLKRLDRLTQEEARMAAAQLLKVTNTINSDVREVADNVVIIGDRVASVNDRLVGVDEHVAGVVERVAGVDDRVAGVDERVAGVDERVAGVDERIAGVDERVAGVDGHVACVDNRVVGIGDQVQGVDEKVMAVIDGAQYIYYYKIISPITRLDGKAAREVIQQAADSVDRIERSWFSKHIHSGLVGSII